MSDYNGWTNYATWRINLEIFDGYESQQYCVSDLVQELKDYVDDCIIDQYPDGLVKDYALAFISDVNWYEIAEHIIQDRTANEEEEVTE